MAAIKIEYDAEGAKYGVPWKISSPSITVRAAGYSLSRALCSQLDDAQWLAYSSVGEVPLNVVGEMHIQPSAGNAHVHVCTEAEDPYVWEEERRYDA